MSQRKDYFGILMDILTDSPQLPSALRRKIRVLKEERRREIEEEERGEDVSLAIKVPDGMGLGPVSLKTVEEERKRDNEDGRI